MSKTERRKLISELMEEHRQIMSDDQFEQFVDELTDVSDAAAARKQDLLGADGTLDANSIELRGIEREEALMWCAIKEKFGIGR